MFGNITVLFNNAGHGSMGIFEASTDDSAQLRFVVGEDAKALINLLEKSGDEGFIKQISQMF